MHLWLAEFRSSKRYLPELTKECHENQTSSTTQIVTSNRLVALNLKLITSENDYKEKGSRAVPVLNLNRKPNRKKIYDPQTSIHLKKPS